MRMVLCKQYCICYTALYNTITVWLFIQKLQPNARRSLNNNTVELERYTVAAPFGHSRQRCHVSGLLKYYNTLSSESDEMIELMEDSSSSRNLRCRIQRHQHVFSLLFDIQSFCLIKSNHCLIHVNNRVLVSHSDTRVVQLLAHSREPIQTQSCFQM